MEPIQKKQTICPMPKCGFVIAKEPVVKLSDYKTPTGTGTRKVSHFRFVCTNPECRYTSPTRPSAAEALASIEEDMQNRKKVEERRRETMERMKKGRS